MPPLRTRAGRGSLTGRVRCRRRPAPRKKSPRSEDRGPFHCKNSLDQNENCVRSAYWPVLSPVNSLSPLV